MRKELFFKKRNKIRIENAYKDFVNNFKNHISHGYTIHSCTEFKSNLDSLSRILWVLSKQLAALIQTRQNGDKLESALRWDFRQEQGISEVSFFFRSPVVEFLLWPQNKFETERKKRQFWDKLNRFDIQWFDLKVRRPTDMKKHERKLEHWNSAQLQGEKTRWEGSFLNLTLPRYPPEL